jgi:Zn-finger protein
VVHNETCLTFNDAHEINIKVEGDTDETGSYTETCLTSADDVHGVVKIRVEEDIGESGSCMETCLTSSGVAKEVIRTKAEEDTDELRSCTKTYLSSSADSHEVVLKEIVEGTDVEVENFAESVTFPEIKTDRQATQNEQLRTHSGEHLYSCDVCNKAFSRQSSLVVGSQVLAER